MIQQMMGAIALERQKELLREAEQERLASLARAHRRDQAAAAKSRGGLPRSTGGGWLVTSARPAVSSGARRR